MSAPDISIIIPTHNNGDELRRAILSVRAQDVRSLKKCAFEIIIVNDASAPEYTQQHVQLMADFPECRLLQTEQQSGPAVARNLGILAARGALIGFLDADDEWPEDKLSIQLPYFDVPETEIVGGKVKYIIQDGLPDINIVFEDEQRRITHVHMGALLARRTVFEKDLLFDTSLTCSEDTDWWLRVREKNLGIIITEATTLLYHVHGRNMSVNKSMKDLQLLKALHQSVKRRSNTPSDHFIPQLKDFRVGQDDPLISIIFPLYNETNLIRKSLDSLLAQTYTNWELIVVADDSIRDGAAFIEQHYPKTVIISQKNAGVAAILNTGISHSNGGIIAFLDPGDEWAPSKLREQWEVLKKDPYCGFVTCNQCFIAVDGLTLPVDFSGRPLEAHRSLLSGSMLIRKHVLLRAGRFDESAGVSGDVDLIHWLRKTNCKEDNVDSLLLKKRVHGDATNYNKQTLRRELSGLSPQQLKRPMNNPAIDVIIPVYNGEKYIREAVASVQAQSWKHLNIIIVDDGSTDDTLSIITALSLEDSRIKVFACAHRGVSAALNSAINEAGADYISFLDADDLWHAEKLEKQMHTLAQSEARICCCMVQEFESLDPEAPRTHMARSAPMKGYVKTGFLGERKLFGEFGLFDEQVIIGDFVEWFSRLVRVDEPVVVLDEVLAYRRVHANNTMRTAPKNAFLTLLKTHLDERRKSAG